MNKTDLEISEIVAILQEASDRYYNDGESDLTDAEYDSLENTLKTLDPLNPFLLGVGATERGEKVPLPVTMGSLDQLYEGDVGKWIEKENLYDKELIATEKLDGTSALIVYGTDGNLQIAYSRGNGTEGADITRHVKQMKNVPQKVSGPMMVRVEAILPKEDWLTVKKIMEDTTDRVYKNARNWGAGQMNKKIAEPVFYEYQHIVAYDVLHPTGLDKKEQIKKLENEGFITPYYIVCNGDDKVEDRAVSAIKHLKTSGRYEIDGMVIDIDSALVRKQIKPKDNSMNPGFAKKFKIGGEDNVAQVSVVKVHWNASKHGYIKPRVEIEPVDLVGVTITYATGFNAKFIKENNIGPGAVVQITRAGDVIPFIQKVIVPGTPQLPVGFGEMVWSENEVDLIMVEENDQMKFEQLMFFFGKIGVEHAGEGNLQKVFDAGYRTGTDCVQLNQANWENLVGNSAGQKIFESLHTKLKGIKLAKLAAASGCFDRGIGERKLQAVIDIHNKIPNDATVVSLVEVEGVSEKTATKILEGAVRFDSFLESMKEYVTLEEPKKPVEGGRLSAEYLVFTGIRDADLEASLVSLGATVGSSMGKCTILVAKDPNSNSGKAKKARDAGIRIISHAEAKGLV